jgi:hypothetical protein
MERIKVGVIVGEAKGNTSKIKNVIDKAKAVLQKKKDIDDAEKEFEIILSEEVPAFNSIMLSEDALVELPLLSLFDVDENGNIYMDKNKVFNIDAFSLLPEIVGLFNRNIQTSFLIINKSGVSLEDIANDESICYCRKEKGIAKTRVSMEEIFDRTFSSKEDDEK